MEFIQNLFSSQPALSRLNPIGVIMLLVGAVLAAIIAPRIEKKSSDTRGGALPFYAVGLLLAAIGAMIAIR